MTEQRSSARTLTDALPPAELDRLRESLPRRPLPAGAVLLTEGQPGDVAFLIVDGELEIIKALGTGEERLLAVTGPGEIVGEMSLLNPGQPRSASIRARVPTVVMELGPIDFDHLMRRNPVLFYEMARELSRRLRDSDNATIRDLRATNQALARALDDLKAAQAEIVEKQVLEHELAVAKDIQRAMLPRRLPRMTGFDFGMRMEPARAVGGDFYDFIPLAKDRLGIVVGDVAGKGVPAALVMGLTRSLLRPEAGHGRSPLQTVRAINRYLQETNQSGLFVTLLYGILDPTTSRFTYVRAGHEMPLLYDAQGALQPQAMAIGQPLGVLDAPALTEQSLTVEAGGLLLLHSDGAPDTLNDQHVRFGNDRLQTLVSGLAGLSAQAACDGIVAALNRYRADTPQADDLTLVAVRAT